MRLIFALMEMSSGYTIAVVNTKQFALISETTVTKIYPKA